MEATTRRRRPRPRPTARRESATSCAGRRSPARPRRRRATNLKNVPVIRVSPDVNTRAVTPAHSMPPLANIAVSTAYTTAVSTKNAVRNSNSLASICMSCPYLLAWGAAPTCSPRRASNG
jgi:hypothetical protein